MEELEDADPGSSTRTGWLNRLIGTTAGDSPLQGLFVGGGVVPTALYGPAQSMATYDVDSVAVAGEEWGAGRTQSLQTLWATDPTPLAPAMRSTLTAAAEFAPAKAAASNASAYPSSDLARGLSIAARMIRADVGIQVLTLDQGEWDMHTTLGTINNGLMLGKADELASAIKAFFADLGTQRSKVTLLAFSEFGRRLQENANLGLDHGSVIFMWVFGAGVRGVQYYVTFPTLANTPDADLLVTTDYRNVLADVVQARFGASTASVFPGLTRRTTGLMYGV